MLVGLIDLLWLIQRISQIRLECNHVVTVVTNVGGRTP